MANENAKGNSYTPLKNPELLEGQPDNRSLSQRIEDGKKGDAKKDNEKWVEQAKRTTPKEFSKEKDLSKDELEKDK